MKIATLLFLFLFFNLVLHAQSKSSDMECLQAHVATENNMQNTPAKMQTTGNPVKMVLFLPLYFYQRIISEQISAVCGFEPSCSAFSIQSIKKLGIIKGLFLTADRLTRCNGEAQRESENYLFDPLKAKVIDAPDMYRFKN